MDDEEDAYVPRVAWGDLSAIAVAGCFSLLVLGLIAYMFLGGHPLAGIIGAPSDGPPAQAEQPTQAEVPMTLAPGEVRITVPPKAKKQPPKP
jgi:hypothetical protein